MQGRKPTRRQKKLLTKWGLKSENWLVLKATPERTEIAHRHTGATKTIPEGAQNESAL